MSENAQVVSKVLVVDDGDTEVSNAIKFFCIENNLIGLKTHSDNVMNVLKSNVDLGGILLSEHYNDNPTGGVELGCEIHRIRPELPIFLRREQAETLDDLDRKTQKSFCAAYTVDTIDSLRQPVDDYIFSFAFPNVLVRGIQEITESALLSQFRNFGAVCDTPYIVKDRIVCGDVFTLIPLESSWCRGYMMLQSENPPIAVPTEGGDSDTLEPGHISDILGEVTNLIWGAFKNRYISEDDKRIQFQTQVPMLIKLQERNISFGSDDPQLCLKYTLTPTGDAGVAPIYIYQRFVFNLNWVPEDFKEILVSCEELVDSGELELF